MIVAYLKYCLRFTSDITNKTTISKFSALISKKKYIQDVPGGMCQTSGECSLC